MSALIDWIKSHQTLLASLVISGLAVYWLMPRVGKQRRVGPVLLLLGALGTAGFLFLRPHWADLLEMDYHANDRLPMALFWLFAGLSVVSGVAMITTKNPVYAALWFAIVTLSVCGLFLLQQAPILAAATVIVYAGAIIVTFVFVIMLARQGGEASYDQRAQQPLLATVATFLLLGGILTSLMDWREEADNTQVTPRIARAAGFLGVPEGIQANVLSERAPAANPGSLRGLGRSLFGDYLFAVEIAGTLLMVATVGAVAIAPRRAQGGL